MAGFRANTAGMSSVDKDLQDAALLWLNEKMERLQSLDSELEVTEEMRQSTLSLLKKIEEIFDGKGMPLLLDEVVFDIKRISNLKSYNWRIKVTSRTTNVMGIKKPTDPIVITFLAIPSPKDNPVNLVSMFSADFVNATSRQLKDLTLVELLYDQCKIH